MQRFHKPDDEKRMLIILRPDQYDDWLTCPVEDAPNFFTRYLRSLLPDSHRAKKILKTAQICAGNEELHNKLVDEAKGKG